MKKVDEHVEVIKYIISESKSNRIVKIGMLFIEGTTYTMRATEHSNTNDAKSPQRQKINSFWMDETKVTNTAFKTFTEKTGYVTITEQPIK